MRFTALLAVCAVLLTGATAATTTRATTTRATTTTTPADNEDPDGAYVPYQGDRFDHFDWRLCKAMHTRESGNMVISPIGVKLVLAMLYEGSTRATAREIRTTLELPVKRDDVRKIFKAVIDSVKVSSPEYVMDVGTKIYVDNSVKPREQYAQLMTSIYSSRVEQIDFSKPVEAAATINSWVDAVTKGRVQNLVPPGDETMASKVLLLVNAIFFKGLWRHPFNPADTKSGRFQVGVGKSVAASYMKVTNRFYIYESEQLQAKIVRLPYQGKKFSMFVVLPDSPTGLNALLERVTPDTLRKYMWDMQEGSVEVILPKFKFTFTADLSDALKELGIHDLFEDTASLAGMVEGGRQPQGFKVSDVLQKAGLEVGEKGTTAYGVTSVTLVNKLQDDYTFNATHPFMFYIEDEAKGTVVFVGKVVDPSKMDTIAGQFAGIPTHSSVPTSTSSLPRHPGGQVATTSDRRTFVDSDAPRGNATSTTSTRTTTRRTTG